MPIEQSDLLMTKKTRGKGRGVFARSFIPAGTEIERVPLLIVDTDSIDDSSLMDYVYYWNDDKVAVALGYGSLYNHSYSPNARYDDKKSKIKVFEAIADIQPGEEITINYNGCPDSRDDVGFPVED